MPAMARAGSGKSQEPGTPLISLTWGVGAQALQPSVVVLQDALYTLSERWDSAQYSDMECDLLSPIVCTQQSSFMFISATIIPTLVRLKYSEVLALRKCTFFPLIF